MCDGGTLLTNGVVNTDQVVALIVDDGVERNRGLAGLAVANDQLALPSPDGNHAVNGLQSRGHGLAYRLAGNYTRSQTFQSNELIGRDGALVVNRLPHRIDHPANQSITDRHAHDAAGSLNLVAFLDFRIFAKQHHTNLVLFQVHGDSGNAVGERQQFTGHDFIQAIDASDTVAERDDGADFIHRDLGFVVLNLFAD